MKKKRLGEVLRDRGLISVADLDKAIEGQQGKVVRLGELMLERGAELTCGAKLQGRREPREEVV
jgi:hypothetical protein